METRLPLCVMDNSFLFSGIFSASCDDENTNALDYIENIVSQNGQIYVPQLFWFEFGDILLNASKPKKNGDDARITQIQMVRILQLVEKLPFHTDLQPDDQVMQRIMAYALEFNLSFHNAAYLELSKRYDIPLMTFDEELIKALKR